MTTCQWHNVVGREFFFFRVIAERLQTRKACQCSNFAQSFNQDHLRNFVGIAFRAADRCHFEIVSFRSTLGIAQYAPFWHLEVSWLGGMGLACVFLLNLFPDSLITIADE